MNRIIIIFVLTISVFSFNLNSQSEKIALAGRYIKLANTYINTEDINTALDFLKKADEALANQDGWEADYWKAAADETYGVAFLKMRIPDEARKHFQRALDRYQRLITMKNGSPEAVEQLMAHVESLMGNSTAGSASNPRNSAVAGLVFDTNVMNYDNLKLRTLPNDVPQKVINISLANNKLKEFPTGLSSFKSLKYINLANNKIVTFNPDYSSFKSLVWLNLAGNKIKLVPAGISEMKNLEYIDLSNNRLKEIPSDLAAMKSLKVVNLKGNKIPFTKIKNLLQAMPNTNILHDEYIIKEEEETDEEF